MDLGKGWDQSESVLRQLIQLDLIYDAGPIGTHVNALALFQDLSEQERETVRGDLREFEREGLIDLTETYDDESIDCVMLSPGAAFVEQVRQRRGDLAAKRLGARDAVLRWLYDRHVQGDSAPQWSTFWGKPEYALFYAQHFGNPEVDQAVRWLRDKGYVTGVAAQDGSMPRPRITTPGEDVIESGRSVNDPRRPNQAVDANSVYISIPGFGNVVQVSSPGATASVITTITSDERQQTLALADLLEQSLPALNLPPEAAAVPSELRRAAQQDDRGVMKEALRTAELATAASMGTALGAVIFQNLHPLLAAFGLG